MRLTLILPPVQPEVYPEVTGCPYAGCGGQHLQHWQAVPKPLRDTQLHEVVAMRSRCVRCGWWVKERYRSMRGYKRPESVLTVSRLIAVMGDALEGPGFTLAEVIA